MQANWNNQILFFVGEVLNFSELFTTYFSNFLWIENWFGLADLFYRGASSVLADQRDIYTSFRFVIFSIKIVYPLNTFLL